MAYSSIWYFSKIPIELTDLICREVSSFDNELQTSEIIQTTNNQLDIDRRRRSSKHSWIPSSHWIHGLLWHYVTLANRDNFLYDIECIDGGMVQYTKYNKGDFYAWHSDTLIDYSYKPKYTRTETESIAEDKFNLLGESSRKLSFVMQLTDESEYEGGEVQVMDSTGELYSVPKERGAVIIFDSRLTHRVRKVRSGVRKSLVGWAVGPRWR